MNITLNKQLDLRSVSKLKTMLEDAFTSEGEVVLEIGAVEQIDTSSLQLITAFSLALHAQGRTLQIQQESEVFSAQARRLGLTSMLGLSQIGG